MPDEINSSSPRMPEGFTSGPGNGGLTRITVTVEGAEAEIYLNGATLTRYEVEGEPVLFCSRTSKYEPGKAIRGGVPVIFPWFGPHPTEPGQPQHGLVRAADWHLDSMRRIAPDLAELTLTFESSDATRAAWPFDFGLRYTVSVGKRLEMALEVTNRSMSDIRFDEALHTYLAVGDVRKIAIAGLEDCEYVDKVDGGARKRLGAESLRLTGETDRVFVDTSEACRLFEPGRPDVLVGKEGSLSTVVWNPWETKAEAMSDLAGGQWPGMVCIETVNALENAVTLSPGASHTMKAIVERL
jgi:D-hexose-6-phosphate mutarotase